MAATEINNTVGQYTLPIQITHRNTYKTHMVGFRLTTQFSPWSSSGFSTGLFQKIHAIAGVMSFAS